MRLLFIPGLLAIGLRVLAQAPSNINEQDVRYVENILAADNMQGRKVFSTGIERAADFIKKEFKEAGLKPVTGSNDGFNQSFTMIGPESTEVIAELDGQTIEARNVLAFSSSSSLLSVTPADHYQKVFVKKGSDFRSSVYKYLDSEQNVLVFVDTSFAKNFARLARSQMHQFERKGNRIFILTSIEPKLYNIQVNQKMSKQNLTNLVGIIPGKSRPDEYVIFSAHYDHLGIGKPDEKGDSIYNGANDDASGTTAVITLAKYFSRLHNNGRTLIFVAFTAEEIGEFGSAYFVKTLNPDKVVAMFNIEMIGTESKWGKNSAYITGFEKSDMGQILQKNLINSPFKFYPDPYPEQGLFLRSDNASLAKRGVPAHTISTSKMNSEKYYHTPGDEVETLDLKNMTEIIRAIGLSSRSIISGQDTPQRLKTD